MIRVNETPVPPDDRVVAHGHVRPRYRHSLPQLPRKRALPGLGGASDGDGHARLPALHLVRPPGTDDLVRATVDVHEVHQRGELFQVGDQVDVEGGFVAQKVGEVVEQGARAARGELFEAIEAVLQREVVRTTQPDPS